MPGPLHGINVVEFSTMIATPTAGMLLADMGASVIKVEPPWGDLWRYAQAVLPTDGRPFMAYNRGKRSMTLDLTRSEAADVVRRLTQQADVILANNRPDVAGRLGIDYETLSAINPAIIYCEGSAFGHEGPDAYRPRLRHHHPGHVRHRHRRGQGRQRRARADRRQPPRRFRLRIGPGLGRLRRAVRQRT